MRKDYYKGTRQLSLGEAFDMDTARQLALAAGREGGKGVGKGNGNLSALARDVLGLPAEAGPELAALIEKYKKNRKVKRVTGILAIANEQRADHTILTEDACLQMVQQLNDKFPGCVSYNKETGEVIWDGSVSYLAGWDDKYLGWSIKSKKETPQ